MLGVVDRKKIEWYGYIQSIPVLVLVSFRQDEWNGILYQQFLGSYGSK